MCHNCTGTNNSPLSNMYTRHNHCRIPNPDIVIQNDWTIGYSVTVPQKFLAKRVRREYVHLVPPRK